MHYQQFRNSSDSTYSTYGVQPTVHAATMLACQDVLLEQDDAGLPRCWPDRQNNFCLGYKNEYTTTCK